MLENKSQNQFSEDDAKELSKAGFRALENHDIPGAEANFRRILEIDQKNCYAFVGLAECAKKNHNLEGAVEWYLKCLESDSKNQVSVRGLFVCYADLKRFELVAEMWEEYQEILRESDSLVLKAADSFRKTHNNDMAALLYNELLDGNPDNKYALSGMGHLLYEEESHKESIQYWQRLIELDRSNVFAHTCLGNCCRKLRNFENGLEYYARAIEIEPDNFYALFGLADCCRGLGRFQESLTYWQSILESDPANRMILTRAGEACARLGRDADAKSYFADALSKGEDLYALIGMARLAKAEDDTVAAVDLYRRARAVDQSHSRFSTEIDSFLQEF